MTLLRKPSTLFLMVMFTVIGALLGAAASASHVVVIPSSPSSAFAQTSPFSLAQDIIDETSSSNLSVL